VAKFFRENNCRRYDWSSKGAAAGFINAGDGRDAEGAELSFMPESATSIHGYHIVANAAPTGKSKVL
jgi:hypothetical protein